MLDSIPLETIASDSDVCKYLPPSDGYYISDDATDTNVYYFGTPFKLSDITTNGFLPIPSSLSCPGKTIPMYGGLSMADNRFKLSKDYINSWKWTVRTLTTSDCSALP